MRSFPKGGFLVALGLCAGCHVTMRPPLAEPADVTDASVTDITDTSVTDITSADTIASDVATADVPIADATPLTDGPPSDGPSATYLAALRRIRVAACERAQRCSTARDLTVDLCVAGSYRFVFEPVAPRLARQRSLLEAGTLTFDPAAVDVCLDAIARSCEVDFVVGDHAGPACANLLHGRAAMGASCQGTEDCTAGLRCRTAPPNDGGPGCPGVCVAPVARDYCLEGSCGTFQCNGHSCVSAPFEGTRGRGEQCGGIWSADGSTRYFSCAAGTSCQRGVEASFYCLPITCPTPCAHDQRCDYATQRCVTPTLLGAGADCAAAGSACDPRLGLRCAAGRCAPRVMEGGACEYDDCAAGLTCLGGACRRRAPLPAGAACTEDAVCESGLCVGFLCTNPTCWS